MGITQKAPVASTFGDTSFKPSMEKQTILVPNFNRSRINSPENQAMMFFTLNAQKVISLNASHASLISNRSRC